MPGQSGYPKSAWKAEILFRLRHGPWRAIRWMADRIFDSVADRRFGISSSERQEIVEVALHSAEFVHYQAVSYLDMRQILASLTITPDDVFLDYGSGMGRAVCLAATHPFRAVLGVELSPQLCQIARRNIAQVQSKLRCSDVRIINGDATRYELPPEVSVVFFFNPFGGAALSQVFDNIAASLRRSPRHLRLIFYGTVSSRHFRDEASRHAWLSLQSELILATGAVALSYGAVQTKS